MKIKSAQEFAPDDAESLVLRQMAALFQKERDHQSDETPSDSTFPPNPEVIFNQSRQSARGLKIAGVILCCFIISILAIFCNLPKSGEDISSVLLISILFFIFFLITGIVYMGLIMREESPSKVDEEEAKAWGNCRRIAIESGAVFLITNLLCASKASGIMDEARSLSEVSQEMREMILSVLVSMMRDRRHTMLHPREGESRLRPLLAIEALEDLQQLAAHLGFTGEYGEYEAEDEPVATM